MAASNFPWRVGCRVIGIGVAGLAVVGSVAAPFSEAAVRNNYPNAGALCAATGNVSGPCDGYDWGYNRQLVVPLDPAIAPRWVVTDRSPDRGYFYRNCTDWVSFHLQDHFGVPGALIVGLGNGGWWSGKSTTIGAGKQGAARILRTRHIVVDTIPAVGAVVVRRSTSNNPKSPAFFGHVAVIDAVAADDQTITVSAYNAGLNGRFSVETGTLPSLQFDDVIHFEKFATKNLPPPPLPDPRGHHPAQWNYRS